MRKTKPWLAIALLALSGCATVKQESHAREERLLNVRNARQRAAAENVDLGPLKDGLDLDERELAQGYRIESDFMEKIDLHVKDAAEMVDRELERRAAAQREKEEADREAEVVAASEPRGYPFWQILLSHGRPEKGQLLDLESMQVLQKSGAGFLITVPADLVGAYSPPSPVFLRTSEDYVDGERVRGSAVFEGKTFAYATVLGSNATVLEVRAVKTAK